MNAKKSLKPSEVRSRRLYLRQNTVKINLRRIEDKKAEIVESYGDLELENKPLEVQKKESWRKQAGFNPCSRKACSTEPGYRR